MSRRGWAIGLLLAGAGCVASEPLLGPDATSLEGAASAVLFRPAGDQVELLGFDPQGAFPPLTLGGGGAELWLYGCDFERLSPQARLTGVGTLVAAPSPSQAGCALAGAPCPFSTLRLEPEAAEPWSQVPVGRQPWPTDMRPSPCADFSEPLPVPLPDLPRDGGPDFIVGLGSDHVLLASNHEEPDRATLWLLAIPPGPLTRIEPPLTSSTTPQRWNAAGRLPDGRVLAFDPLGRAVRIDFDGQRLSFEETGRMESASSTCANRTRGYESNAARVVLAHEGPGGLNQFVLTACGELFRRVEDGEWRSLHQSPPGFLIDAAHLGLAAAGPDELYASGSEPGGLVHVLGDGVTIERINDVGVEPTFVLGGPPGHLFAGGANNQVFERVEGSWRPIARVQELEDAEVGLIDGIPLADGLIIGSRLLGDPIIQITPEGLCEPKYQPPTPAGFTARAFVNVNGHLVGLFRLKGAPMDTIPLELTVFDAQVPERCDQPAQR